MFKLWLFSALAIADNKQAFTFDVINPKTRAVIKSECLFYNLIVHPDHIELEGF